MQLERININFMNNCSMNCPYCYIPSLEEKVDFEKFLVVLEKCKALNIKVLTFGGGDPFNYEKIFEIFDYSKKLGFEIHVDTNGINMYENDYEKICETISLLSFPLDGSNEAIHNKMRNSKSNHHSCIINHITFLEKLDIKLKINTVASKINYEDVLDIAYLLNNYNIHIWSLYQFFPLHNAINANSQYFLSDEKFSELVSSIKTVHSKYTIEPGSIQDRYGVSLFMSPNGTIYIHDPLNINNYIFIGSIFEDSWKQKFFETNTKTMRSDIKYRYDIFI
ncbi:MAG: radical SAM protein [bacterium]|nr:radical SAM protein [bacterium]